MDQQRNIFEIPEVVRMIVHYLTRSESRNAQLLFGSGSGSGSIINCMQVCRLWYTIFLPYNYASIALSSGSIARYTSSLVKHSHFIQKIRLYSARSCQLPITFPYLTDLSTEFCPNGRSSSKGSETAYTNSLAVLIKVHQSTLRSLTVDASVNQKLLEAIAGCSSLRRFSSPVFTVDCTPEQYVELHPKAWAHVEEVQVYGEFMFQKKTLTVAQAIKARKTLPTTKIRKLDIPVHDLRLKSMGVPLLLVMTSPELTHLSWYTRSDKYARYQEVFAMEMLAKAAKAGALKCPQLQELTLERGHFESEHFVLMMGALLSVTKLDLSYVAYGFDIVCAKALTTTFPTFRTTLRELRLLYSGVDGEVILEIMASLTGLEVFQADIVRRAELIRDDRPWVCLGMKQLVLGFSRDDKDADAECLFLERVAKLEKLESLRLDPQHLDATRCLRVTFDKGLHNLKSLKSLKHFQGPDIHGRCFRWGLPELDWMMKHWVNIKTIGHIKFDEEETTKNYLAERNVQIARTYE